MAVTQTVSRTVKDNGPEIVGGGVGVGAPVVLRRTVDVRNGQVTTLLGTPDSMLGRLTRPSVAWGLGLGTITGLAAWRGVGDQTKQDFCLAHAATGIPTGIASFLLPVQAGSGNGNGGAASAALDRLRRGSSSMNDGASAPSEFDDAGGTSPETQPAG